MLEIIGLIFYARYLGQRTFGKGYSRGAGIGIAAGFWVGLELIGFLLGGSLIVQMGWGGGWIFLFMLAGAALGAAASWFLVSNMWVRKEAVLARLRSEQVNDRDSRALVLGLAGLGSNALPCLTEMYEREVHWPRSESFRAVLVEAITKAGGTV